MLESRDNEDCNSEKKIQNLNGNAGRLKSAGQAAPDLYIHYHGLVFESTNPKKTTKTILMYSISYLGWDGTAEYNGRA